MLTPLEIENKKFAKQMVNGYSVEEVDEFLDEVTIDYERMYKKSAEQDKEINKLKSELEKYQSIEATLQSTLVMAQSTAEEVKKVAKQQAEQIVREAQSSVRREIEDLENQAYMKKRELAEVKKQFDIYKAKMESLLISQLELLKEIKIDGIN